jgi:hypothetical protein
MESGSTCHRLEQLIAKHKLDGATDRGGEVVVWGEANDEFLAKIDALAGDLGIAIEA